MQIEAGRSLRTTRWLARAPRFALIVACLALMLAGIRATLTSAPAMPPQRPVAAESDPAADGFAEAGVRAHLTWDGTTTADRVAAFGSAVTAPR